MKSKSTMSCLGAIAVVLCMVTVGLGAAGADGSCLNSGDECQCSPQTPGGMCMRHQGGGKCLMGTCKVGYRCDCFGFEVCKKRGCRSYTTLENEVPSTTKLFGCHMTPDAGRCVDYTGFGDTVTAAWNAQAAADNNNVETLQDERDVTEVVKEIEKDVKEANALVKEVFMNGDEVTDEEYDDIAKEAMKIVECGLRALGEKLLLGQESAAALRAFLQAGKFRAQSQRLEKEEKKAKEEKKRERLRKQRRDAAIAACSWAKKGREHGKNAKERREGCEREQVKAREARGRCGTLASGILGRVRRRKL